MDKIDFVITWVDGNDKNWQLDKEKYRRSKKNDASASRYRDWEILRFWFRSIEENASWVNKIYFITYGHLPEWLDTSNKKLVIVNHNDFIPKKYLPTFNSCSIELNMHRIVGLSEKFVYFNDDMFLNKKVKISDFFENSLPKDSMILTPINASDDVSSCIHYNCMKIINKYFEFSKLKKKFSNKLFSTSNGKYLIKNLTLSIYPFVVGLRFHHLPTSFLKKSFHELWDKENTYFDEVCSDKFRTQNDVSQWVVQFWQLMKNRFSIRNVNFGKYYDLSRNFEEAIDDIRNSKHSMICLNDTSAITDFERKKEKLIKCLEERYPKISTFEKK